MSDPRPPQTTARGVHPDTALILTVAFLLRVLLLWFVAVHLPHNWFYTRGIELGTLAQHLLTGAGFSSPFGVSTGPTALLTPGYPALIALLFLIFGPFTFSAAIAVMGMQLAFNVLTVLLILHVAGTCFDRRSANFAGTLWAVSLPILWMPTIFWETCLSTLLLTGMIALALRCERQPDGLMLVSMGAYAGLTALVNPALLPTFLAILGWAAWRTQKRFGHLFVALLAFAAVFAPWPLRNARVMHAFIPMRTTVGFELWVGNRSGATGFLDESQFPLFNPREMREYVAKGEVAYMSDKSTLARAYIRAHPLEFLQRTGLRFVRFWTGTGTKEGSIFFFLHATLTTTLGWIGMWRLVQQRRLRLACLFCMPLILFPIPYYLTHAEFRYRLLLDPLLAALSGYAVSGFRERRAARSI